MAALSSTWHGRGGAEGQLAQASARGRLSTRSLEPGDERRRHLDPLVRVHEGLELRVRLETEVEGALEALQRRVHPPGMLHDQALLVLDGLGYRALTAGRHPAYAVPLCILLVGNPDHDRHGRLAFEHKRLVRLPLPLLCQAFRLCRRRAEALSHGRRAAASRTP